MRPAARAARIRSLNTAGHTGGGGGGGGIRLMGATISLSSGAQIISQGFDGATPNVARTSNGGTCKVFYGSLDDAGATITAGRVLCSTRPFRLHQF